METETGGVLKKMAKTEPKAVKSLQAGLTFWSSAEWWLRLDEGRGGSLLPKPGPDREWLAKICGEPDASSLMRKAAEISRETRKAYEEVLARLLQKS